MKNPDQIQTEHELRGALDEATFRKLKQPPMRMPKPRPFRTMQDAELVEVVRQNLPVAAEFDDGELVEYAGRYLDKCASNLDAVTLMIMHCRDRLEKRDAGAPADDDPVGLELMADGKTRRGQLPLG